MLRMWGTRLEFVPVNYHFDVYTNVIRMFGFPPTDGQRRIEGVIHGQDNQVFNEGDHELVMEDGRKFRVHNIMGSWHILANP